MIADDQIMPVYNRFEKIKAGDQYPFSKLAVLSIVYPNPRPVTTHSSSFMGVTQKSFWKRVMSGVEKYGASFFVAALFCVNADYCGGPLLRRPSLWESHRVGSDKGWQDEAITVEDGMKAVLIGALILAALFLPFAVFFVCIVWTHRLDLSVLDIFRECVQKIRNSLAGDDSQRKGE